MLGKCKIQAVGFNNVVQIPEFSVKSDKKPEKYAQEQNLLFHSSYLHQKAVHLWGTHSI